MASESQKRASAKYDKANTVGFYMKLNTKTDADIISHLQQQANRMGYVKKLIRDDMAKTK